MDPRKFFYQGNANVGGQPTSWYQSTIVNQGWSNNGQLMGASIGPGSSSQSINLSWNKGYNKIGIFVERTAYNHDFYSVAYITPYYGIYVPLIDQNVYGYYNRYWVDITQSIQLQLMPIKNILLAASFTNTNSLNYRWIRIEDGSKYDEPSPLSDKFNQQFQMSIKYLLHASVK
jgi:hypothetical protein